MSPLFLSQTNDLSDPGPCDHFKYAHLDGGMSSIASVINDVAPVLLDVQAFLNSQDFESPFSPPFFDNPAFFSLLEYSWSDAR